MKPLIVFEIPEYDPERAEQLDKYLQEHMSKDYDLLVVYGEVKVSVYNIPFLVKIYYKIKSWLILKTLKKHTF